MFIGRGAIKLDLADLAIMVTYSFANVYELKNICSAEEFNQ